MLERRTQGRSEVFVAHLPILTNAPSSVFDPGAEHALEARFSALTTAGPKRDSVAALRSARGPFAAVLAATLAIALGFAEWAADLQPDQLAGLASGILLLAVVGILDAILLARGRRSLETAHQDLQSAAASLLAAHEALLAAHDGLRQTAAARDRALADLAVVHRDRETFLATIAHDLKTPLTLIRGHAQLLAGRARINGLAREPVPHARLEAGLGSIDANVSQMTGMLDELLDLARNGTGSADFAANPAVFRLDRQDIDLVALVTAVARHHDHATERHRIEVCTPVSPLIGHWDGPRLERALANLLTNAVRYSPAGGTIVVTLDREPVAEVPEWAVITVRDQGLGIPASDVPHVFDRFFRGANVSARADLPGTGLGLASVRQTIERHGGTVAVTSVEGAGSVFTLRLPLNSGTYPHQELDAVPVGSLTAD